VQQYEKQQQYTGVCRMRKRDGMLIFWPAYFEKNNTRLQGRKIPSNLAASDVTIDILEEAAEASGFEYEIDRDKRYPRNWIEKKGYIVVTNEEGHKKKRILLMLAKGVRRAIAKRESARLVETSKKGKKKHRK
jgi:signal recognition particle subunit SRP19